MIIGKKYHRFIEGVQVPFSGEVMVGKFIHHVDGDKKNSDMLVFGIGEKLCYCSGGEFREID